MVQERDKLAQLLFPEGGGAELLNFKLFRGPGEAISESLVRNEIHSALVQAWVSNQAETRTDFPRSTRARVNVAEMVERL